MKTFFLALVATVLVFGSANADEIRFKFNNPAFGGNPFNGPYLLSNAQVQRKFEDPKANKSPTEEFSQNIMRSILSRVSREISEQIVGENAKDSGVIEVDSTVINFQREGETVTINVFDALSGDNTTVKIPVVNFN